VKDEKEYANIPVLLETKQRVDRLANKGETYDEFINKLLDLLEKKRKVK